MSYVTSRRATVGQLSVYRACLRVVCLAMVWTSISMAGQTRGLQDNFSKLTPDQNSTSSAVSDTSAEDTGLETWTIVDPTQKPAAPPVFSKAQKVMEGFYVYGHGILGGIAVLGNIVNIVVMLRRCPNISPYSYMTSLAVCDLFTGVTMIWMSVLASNHLILTSYPVRIIKYYTFIPANTIREALNTIASFLTMALSIDRMIAIKFPLKRVSWCTLTRARLATAFIVIFGTFVNLHFPFRLKFIWIYNSYYGIRIPALTYTAAGFNPNFTDLVLFVTLIIRILIPLVSLMITNTLTLMEVIRSRRFRESVSQKAKSDESSQCLAMTIGVIVIFILTNLPRAVYYMRLAIGGKDSRTLTAIVLSQCSELILWLNVSVNFFIYAILNQKFRQDVLAIFCCRDEPNTAAVVTKMSFVRSNTSSSNKE